MKEGNKHRFRFLKWEFSDWMDWRPQLRGESKRKQQKLITKAARNKEKLSLIKDLNDME